jgi:hypothetical protein
MLDLSGEQFRTYRAIQYKYVSGLIHRLTYVLLISGTQWRAFWYIKWRYFPFSRYFDFIRYDIRNTKTRHYTASEVRGKPFERCYLIYNIGQRRSQGIPVFTCFHLPNGRYAFDQFLKLLLFGFCFINGPFAL